MDRALAQPQRVGRRLRQTLDPLQRVGGQPRGSDVDRLLEVGALERIGLVEHREDLEVPGAQEALHRDLGPRHVALDQQGAAGILPRALQNRPDAPRGRLGRAGVVRADHPLAGGERHRLDDARQPHLGRERRHVVAGGGHAVLRLRDPRSGQGPPHGRLVARRGDGLGRIAAQADSRTGGRRRPLADVVDGHHGVQRRPAMELLDRVGRRLGPAQRDHQRAVPHRPGQRLAVLGGHHDLGAEHPRRGEEVGRAVRARGEDQEHPGHRSIVGRAP